MMEYVELLCPLQLTSLNHSHPDTCLSILRFLHTYCKLQRSFSPDSPCPHLSHASLASSLAAPSAHPRLAPRPSNPGPRLLVFPKRSKKCLRNCRNKVQAHSANRVKHLPQHPLHPPRNLLGHKSTNRPIRTRHRSFRGHKSTSHPTQNQRSGSRTATRSRMGRSSIRT